MKKSYLFLIMLLGSFFVFNCGGSSSLPSTDECDIPGWYLNPPSDPNYIYETASATSKDMELAVDKAATDARAKVGRTIELKLETLQKKFDEEIGVGENSKLLQQYTQATKTVVTGELMGSKVIKKKICRDGNNFRSYILCEYPIGAASQAFMNQISKQEELYTRFRSSEAFKELEEDVKKYEEFKKNQQ